MSKRLFTLREGLEALMEAFPGAACSIKAHCDNFHPKGPMLYFEAYTDAPSVNGHGAECGTIMEAVQDVIRRGRGGHAAEELDVNDYGSECIHD